MLDFPEDEVDSLHRVDAGARLVRLRAALHEVIAKSRQGSLLRTGIHVCSPAGRTSASRACSTGSRRGARDRDRGPGDDARCPARAIQIEGVPIVVVDTAGLRESRDEIRAPRHGANRHELERADVVLVVLEAGKLEAPEGELPAGRTRISVINKIDLVPGAVAGRRQDEIWISAKTGAGLDVLRTAILEAAGWTSRGETVFLARERICGRSARRASI